MLIFWYNGGMGSMRTKANFLQNIDREFEEKQAQKNANQWGVSYVNLSNVSLNLDWLRLISRQDAKTSRVLVFDRSGQRLKVAAVDPYDPETTTLLRKLEQEKFIVEVFVCSEIGLHEALKLYDSGLLQKKEVVLQSHVQEENQADLDHILQRLKDHQKTWNVVPSSSVFQEIKLASIQLRASDIHFQPEECGIMLRFRIDGVLHDICVLDRDVYTKLVTHIKYEAGMKSNVTDISQDGHIDFMVNERSVDLRVSTLPTPLVESVVIRVLDSGRGIRTLSELGFDINIQKKIQKALQKSNGLILVTGPTGSGKTTTLYSLLSLLNSKEQKIITLEDPIEYRLNGILQSQVNEKKEYNFETGFQAILRHDPDVILVGEVRTFQTARLASESSLTGHMVLSSLHTNSAVGAVARLRNLGLENFNIAPSINLVLAQRLVRTVDLDRVDMVDLPSDSRIQQAFARLKTVFPDRSFPSQVPRVSEKNDVDATYLGRMAIGEVFMMTETIQKMILADKPVVDIEKHLQENTDFLTLFEDGLLKVLEGRTTLEELYRVAG